MVLDALPLPRRGPLIALGLIAMVAMGGSLRNGWVQDDPALIQNNAAVHVVSGLWSGFTEAYWPPPSQGGLYRPLARTSAAMQWLVGGGGLLPFRLVDLALYLGLVLAVWSVARELLPPWPAWAAAALFAAHPVHVEAVAVAVNQGELVIGIVACLIAARWIRAARANAPIGPTIATASMLLLIGVGFKENALVLPLLLGALELTVLRSEIGGRSTRWKGIGVLLVVAAAWWTLRTLVLGDLAGAAPVEGLRGLGAGARALTMLGVAGEWVRLLVWPAHLQGDYSPWEIAPWDHWSGEQTAGTIALFALALALVLSWRRRPAIAFGLLWVVIAIAPISNLVLPTGILLAERTLLLASVGVVIAAAGMLPATVNLHRAWRDPALLSVGALILLGIGRSATRMPVYHTRENYLAALRVDAPESWRTMVGAGIQEMETGDRREGERLLRAANAAWPASPRPLQVLAFYQRLAGHCDAAVPLMEQALWLQRVDRWTRLPLVACLLDLGRYPEARSAALADTAQDANGRALLAAAAIADSAERAAAPAHSIRLPAMPGGLTLIGPLGGAPR